MYLLKGVLPWQGLQAKNKEERYKKILEQKINTTSYDLCNGYPNELERYVEYTKGLEYTEEPDYEMCRGLFMKILRREKLKFDYIYDWTTKEEIRARRELTLKTDVDSHQYQYKTTKTVNVRKTTRGSTHREEDKQDNQNQEVVYRTVQTEDNQNTTIFKKPKTEKEDTKCCIVF